MIDPTKTGVAIQSSPVSSEGDSESTLDNLDANIIKELGLQTDETPSTPDVVTPKPEGTPAAGESKVDEKDAEAAAKAERLSQDNANLRAVLTKIGIDPDSQTAEHLRAGLITVDDVMRARQPVQPSVETQKSDAAASAVPLDQKLVNLQNILAGQKGDVSAEEYRNAQGKMLEVITDLVRANQNITKKQEIDANNQKIQSMIGAAQDVFNKDVTFKIPEGMKEIAQEMFLGAADIEHVELQRQFGERANTPEYFRHSAGKVAPRFNQFLQAVYKAGSQAAVDAINRSKPAGQTVVNPLQPGVVGGTPPPPPKKEQFAIENLDANVDAFLASTETQI